MIRDQQKKNALDGQKRDRQEWNQLFDYNADVRMKNELDWKNKYTRIN